MTDDVAGTLKMLILLFIAEHVLFLFKFLACELIPDEPAWLNSAAMRLEARKEQAISTQKIREEVCRLIRLLIIIGYQTNSVNDSNG